MQDLESLPALAQDMVIDDVTQAEALERNALIPFSQAPLETALPLFLSASGVLPEHLSAASRCLAEAIYYEAGFQSAQERRAVAQVVLNRVRHPAFPSSICAVVYQGAERTTGCQFSFTCDGSMRRPPAASAWRQAQRIASEALSGTVEPSVGMATHFHADYVLPYWAYNLTKIEQVGRHIFYRWNGQWGRRSSFFVTPTFDLGEDIAVADPIDLAPVTASASPTGLATSRVYVPESALRADRVIPMTTGERSRLVVDASENGLVADSGTGTLKDDESGRLPR